MISKTLVRDQPWEEGDIRSAPATLSKCLSDGTYIRQIYACFIQTNATHSMPQSSYYDKQNRPTAALYRARQPYLVKNTLTGLLLLGFVGGVCEWELRANRHGFS